MLSCFIFFDDMNMDVSVVEGVNVIVEERIKFWIFYNMNVCGGFGCGLFNLFVVKWCRVYI